MKPLKIRVNDEDGEGQWVLLTDCTVRTISEDPLVIALTVPGNGEEIEVRGENARTFLERIRGAAS